MVRLSLCYWWLSGTVNNLAQDPVELNLDLNLDFSMVQDEICYSVSGTGSGDDLACYCVSTCKFYFLSSWIKSEVCS